MTRSTVVSMESAPLCYSSIWDSTFSAVFAKGSRKVQQGFYGNDAEHSEVLSTLKVWFGYS